MGYSNLRQCVQDLEVKNELIKIDQEVDPYLEVGAIQRRVFQAQGPALLFNRVKNSSFPMLGNLYGTQNRLRLIFQDTLRTIDKLLKLRLDFPSLLSSPYLLFQGIRHLCHIRPKVINNGPIKDKECRITDLPQLHSWPQDGGSYITLPLVYSEHPENPGFRFSNLGMYRVQLTGNSYQLNQEVGLHYQIHRGIGPHQAKALALNKPLPVNVFVGGPPALTLAAIMPLPENMPEIYLAAILSGNRIPFVKENNGLPIPAEADFCLSGQVYPNHLALEGPFGDHLGYYSLRHEFPVLKIDKIRHRKKAIWPFTTVGRPPQEDSVFGSFIHKLTQPLIPKVFPGIHELNAVDQAGVHPLLLAIGSERYVPFASERIPQELLTNAHLLLGKSQTSLSKYLMIAAREDNPELSCHNIPKFFQHMLERIDFSRDLHFITRTTMDTLDYSGISLNQGSKIIMAATGDKKRDLGSQLPLINWTEKFNSPSILFPGIIVLNGPRHHLARDTQDPEIEEFCRYLSSYKNLQCYPLLVIVDDSSFTTESWDNFLWVTFTRSDPANDIYGLDSFVHGKHWGCHSSIVIDARLKTYHPDPLEPDPEIEKRVDRLGVRGGPLYGII